MGISRIQETTMQGILILAVTAASAMAAQPGYGYQPEFYCRDTNTSVYAEVCLPAFTEKVTPVTLAVKEVVDNDYCFDRVLTVCEETSTTVEREICTYEYEREEVTACGASGYGSPGYGHGEHQYCREEYQTQAYKVPLVTVPLEQSCSLAYPAPKKVCVTKAIEITEVKCEDKIENKCFNVAKFADAENTVDQKEVVIGEPSCEQITLTLPTQACQKSSGYPHHG